MGSCPTLSVLVRKVSALKRGRLAGFSLDRLVRFLVLLGSDVKIVVTPRASGAGQARVIVAWAGFVLSALLATGASREPWEQLAVMTASLGILGPEHLVTPEPLTRITRDPEVMGGKQCLRGLRVTVDTIVGLIAAGRSTSDILALYPYLEADDIRQALAHRARVEPDTTR